VGARDDDDRRLRRQAPEDDSRLGDCGRLDAGQRRAAYMAIALPAGSPLKKPLDEALVGIIASQEWRQFEDGYFSRQQ
jgi:ABC-type amino acid transport substrate-binding protein